MSVACSSSPPLLLISSSSPPPPRRPPPRRPPRRPPRPPRPTATRDPQCSLSDLNHDHPCSVEVRQGTLGGDTRGEVRQGTLGVDTRGVPCRTSTASIPAQCSLPDLNREYPRQVFPAGPHVRRYGTKNAQKKVRKYVRRYAR